MSARRASPGRKVRNTPRSKAKVSKKVEPKKAIATKSAAKKKAKKKAPARAVERKPAAKETARDRRVAKPEPKKVARAVARPADKAKSKPAKSIAAQPAPVPVPARKRSASKATIVAPVTPVQNKEIKMDQSAKPAAAAPAKKAVVRIARGLRTPKHKRAADVAKDAASRTAPPSGRVPSPKIEINPRLESSRHLIKNPPPSTDGQKPMSVAQKHRAAAEAMFARLTVPGEPAPVAAVPPEATNGVPAGTPQALPFAARRPDEGGGTYAMRISERDSLTTSLRLAMTREETLSAAMELANRYQLPPDQQLLLKVVELGDERLTKLSLEELLELEDRGRVRATPELQRTLSSLKTKDPETLELRQLLLEKIGAVG